MNPLKISYAVGGQGQGKELSTGFKLSNTPAPGTADAKTKMTAINLALSKILCDSIVTYHQLLSDGTVPANGVAYVKKLPSVSSVILKGARVQGAKALAELEVVAVFKFECDGGEEGKMEVRGCFLDDEIKFDNKGNPYVVAAGTPAWATQFITDITAACITNETKIMLSPGKKGLTANREVKLMKWGGVAWRQLTVERKSPQQKINSAIKNELSILNRDYVDATTDASGATVALDQAAKDEFAARAALIRQHGTLLQIRKIGIPKAIQGLFTK